MSNEGGVQVNYWLSCVKLKYQSKRTFLRYYLHTLFWNAFDGCGQNEQPFLFFIQKQYRDEIECLVQSSISPNWQYRKLGEVEVVGVKHVKFNIVEGMRLSFNLSASPVKNIMKARGVRGEKWPMTNLQDLNRWMEKRAAGNGFKLIHNNFENELLKVRKSEEVNAKFFKLAACQYDGALLVIDPEKMASALMSGVGSKKSFGFGMLQVGLY